MNYLSYWNSPQGEALLDRAHQRARELSFDGPALSLSLHKEYKDLPPERVRTAVEIVVTRYRARALGEWTSRAMLTQQTLEQATHPLIAAHRAQRFAGSRAVLEIGAGAGFDTAALARVAAKVVALECQERIAEMARWNLAVQGISSVEIRVGDARELITDDLMREFDGIFADPARRTAEGRRISDPREYSPPLDWLQALAISGPCGIKISPGLNVRAVPEWAHEWIGFEDQCREQVLWRGSMVRDGTVSLVDQGVQWAPQGSGASPEVRAALPGELLVEPHAALIRCGYLGEFYAGHSINLVSDHIAYGIARPELPPSPFYDRFEIVEIHPFRRSALKRRLAELEWDAGTEIKKRGIDEDPDRLRRAFDLPAARNNGARGTVILARTDEGHLAYLCKRVR